MCFFGLYAVIPSTFPAVCFRFGCHVGICLH